MPGDLAEKEEKLQRASDELRAVIEKKQETNRLFDMLDRARETEQALERDSKVYEEKKLQASKGERAERGPRSGGAGAPDKEGTGEYQSRNTGAAFVAGAAWSR